jgi:hypothetical protein
VKTDTHNKENEDHSKNISSQKRKNSILLKPKQPTSCFHMFLTEARLVLASKMGSATPSEIVKAAAE